MPNSYALKATPGALTLARRWEPHPDFPTRPPVGGGGTRAGLTGPSTAGRVSITWSSRSRRRMRFEFSALPWELLGRRPVMITLTYPGEWEVWVPDSRTLARHREALKERWRRKYGPPIGVWVTEFQRRGAPHLHLYLGLPDAVSDTDYVGLRKRTMDRKRAERRVGLYAARGQLSAPSGEFAKWLRKAWWEIVGSQLRAHHGRGVDIATAFFSDQAEATANRVRVAEYFWRESGKWAQKQPPPGFGSLKFYGRWGGRQGFTPVVTETVINEQVALELRRMLARLRLGKMREVAERTGRPLNRDAARVRGHDGLTVFGVNGTEVGPRLLECAERVALDKLAQHSSGDADMTRYRPELTRAFPELVVDPEPVRDWPDEFDEQVRREALVDQRLAEADVAAEAREIAIHEHLRAEERRERRKDELRWEERTSRRGKKRN